MPDLLKTIEGYKLPEIEAAKSARPPEAMRRAAAAAAPPRGFLAALDARRARGEHGLIAEIKKASPSKGLIRADFDPASHAAAFERGGAACLSVLTDVPSFRGSLQHMAAARAVTSLPVLRKDFMFDPYQVLEARAWGADCILIILAAVSDAVACSLEDTALSLGMDVLIEVHDDAELQRALSMRSRLIGINNRNLSSFHTTLATSESLAPLVPAGRLVVSESGIAGPDDLKLLAKAGISTFLIGESLMRNADIEEATRALLRLPSGRVGGNASRPGISHEFQDPATILDSPLAFHAARHVNAPRTGGGNGSGHVIRREAARQEPVAPRASLAEKREVPALAGAGDGRVEQEHVLAIGARADIRPRGQGRRPD